MSKTGKTAYLFKNMALFTVSSFVSKLLVFFLVPFYTSVLTEPEYGIADVMQSSLLLLVPLLSVNAGEAALRYGLEYADDRNVILAFGLKKSARSIIPVILLCAVLSLVFPGYRVFFLLFILLYTADVFYEYLLLYCQGTEEVQKMITGSVSSTVFVIISNLVFLLVFRMGIYGYLYAQIIAFSLSALLMFILAEGPERLKKAGLRDGGELENEMTAYGSSMLLYSTASWVNNAVDRYFILFMLGSAANGLYGVAYKIPAILTTIQRVFAMAWQMSAVKEYRGPDREDFFSRMYRSYQTVLITGCGLIILLLKVIAYLMFRNGFYQAWILVPPLLISVVFGALEGFLGSICLAFKDGKSMGVATGTGACFNIVMNYFLIIRMGSFGAALSTLLSYFIMFLMAFIFVRRHVRLKVFIIRDISAFCLLGAEALFVILNVRYQVFLNTGIVLILAALYAPEIRDIIDKGLIILKNRAGKDCGN